MFRMGKWKKFTIGDRRVRRVLERVTNRVFPILNTRLPFTQKQSQMDRALVQQMMAISSKERHLLDSVVEKVNKLRNSVEPIEKDIVELYTYLKAEQMYEHAAAETAAKVTQLSGVMERMVESIRAGTEGVGGQDMMKKLAAEMGAINKELENLHTKFDQVKASAEKERATMTKIKNDLNEQSNVAMEIADVYGSIHNMAEREFGTEEKLYKNIEKQKEKIKDAQTRLLRELTLIQQAA